MLVLVKKLIMAAGGDANRLQADVKTALSKLPSVDGAGAQNLILGRGAAKTFRLCGSYRQEIRR